jgi:Rrf2 family iron-sulfur cluster assembly transcriptional regulator
MSCWAGSIGLSLQTPHKLLEAIMYGKATEIAIAAMSRLAEVYDDTTTRLSAVEIADSRGLQRPFVSKILSALSQAGLIEGTRGPGGGFRFAKHPCEVKLYHVYSLFERDKEANHCPFGGGICSNGDKCPLHDHLVEVKRATEKVLHETTFEVFRVAFQQRKPKAKWSLSVKPGERETYRASTTTLKQT